MVGPQAHDALGGRDALVRSQELLRPSELVLDTLTGRLPRGPQLEVFQPVVVAVAVTVMHGLVTEEHTPKVLLHHLAVLKNVSASVGSRRASADEHLDVAMHVHLLVSPRPRLRAPTVGRAIHAAGELTDGAFDC